MRVHAIASIRDSRSKLCKSRRHMLSGVLFRDRCFPDNKLAVSCRISDSSMQKLSTEMQLRRPSNSARRWPEVSDGSMNDKQCGALHGNILLYWYQKGDSILAWVAQARITLLQCRALLNLAYIWCNCICIAIQMPSYNLSIRRH